MLTQLVRSLLILVFAAALPAVPQRAAAGEEPGTALLAAVNAARLARDAAAVRMEARLTCAAAHHAAELAARQTLDHVSADGTDLAGRLERVRYPFGGAAENLAEGTDRAEMVVALWLDSPGHRRNLLDGRQTEAGIGHAVTGRGRHFWVLVLAHPWRENGSRPMAASQNSGAGIECGDVLHDKPVIRR